MFINLSKNKNAAQIIQYLKKYTSDEFQKDASVVGLIYESHFLDLSTGVVEEIQKLKLPREAYVFVLCISKGIQGNSMANLYQMLHEKGSVVSYMEHIVLGEDLSGEASFVGKKKSKEAEKAVERLTNEIEEKKEKLKNTTFSKVYGRVAKILRLPIVYSFLEKSLDGNRCNKCGHCRGVCPTKKKLQKMS